MKLLEIRTYKLKPDSTQRFLAAFQDALPLIRENGMDVVAFGRSDHEHETFYLIRAYGDRSQLREQQDAFYSSDVWQNGPRRALIGSIDDYLNTLLWLPERGVEDLRTSNGLATPAVV